MPEGSGSSEARAIGGCESPDKGAGERTLETFSSCSLNQLSSPTLSAHSQPGREPGMTHAIATTEETLITHGKRN